MAGDRRAIADKHERHVIQKAGLVWLGLSIKLLSPTFYVGFMLLVIVYLNVPVYFAKCKNLTAGSYKG